MKTLLDGQRLQPELQPGGSRARAVDVSGQDTPTSCSRALPRNVPAGTEQTRKYMTVRCTTAKTTARMRHIRYSTCMDKFPGSVDGEAPSHPGNNIWRKSSRSMSDGHCVEVALADQYVLMRDSKNAAGPELAFATSTWNSFTQNVKSGRAVQRPMPHSRELC
jgi:hypothetical protein